MPLEDLIAYLIESGDYVPRRKPRYRTPENIESIADNELISEVMAGVSEDDYLAKLGLAEPEAIRAMGVTTRDMQNSGIQGYYIPPGAPEKNKWGEPGTIAYDPLYAESKVREALRQIFEYPDKDEPREDILGTIVHEARHKGIDMVTLGGMDYEETANRQYDLKSPFGSTAFEAELYLRPKNLESMGSRLHEDDYLERKQEDAKELYEKKYPGIKASDSTWMDWLLGLFD